MTEHTTTDAFQVTRRTNATGTGACVEYRIELNEGATGEVRLVERLPDYVDDYRITGGSDDGVGTWNDLGDRRVEYVANVGESPAIERLETSVRIGSETCDSSRVVPTLATTEFTDAASPRTNGGHPVSYDGSTDGGSVRAAVRGTTGDPDRKEHAGDRPAVGLLMTGANAWPVFREATRAIERGFDVFVAPNGTQTPEGRRAVEYLGATVVEPESEEPSREIMEATLGATARSQEYPGVVVPADPTDRIDFDESLATFRSTAESVVEAVPEEAATAVMVGIPAYNEAETIGGIVADVNEYVDDVVIVDDGSSDETATVARDAGAAVVEHAQNEGYGGALKTLFDAAARYDVDALVVMDADGQHDPEDVPKLAGELRDDGEMLVIGSRFTPGGTTDIPVYRWFGLAVVNTLVNLSLGIVRPQNGIGDTQSGFRAYNRAAIESLAAEASIGDRMSASIDILYHAHANGFDIVETPTEIDYDVSNASNHNPLLHGKELVTRVFRMLEYKYPVVTLGIPGVGVAAFGSAMFYWTVTQYVATGSRSLVVPFLATALFVIGVLTACKSVFIQTRNVQFETPQ